MLLLPLHRQCQIMCSYLLSFGGPRRSGLIWDGIPLIIDQLNPRYHFHRRSQFDIPSEQPPRHVLRLFTMEASSIQLANLLTKWSKSLHYYRKWYNILS